MQSNCLFRELLVVECTQTANQSIFIFWFSEISFYSFLQLPFDTLVSKMRTPLTESASFGMPIMDCLVIAFSCTILLPLQMLFRRRLQQQYPSLSDAHLDIFSTEGALVPSRVLMAILNVPGLAHTMSSKLVWRPIFSDMAAWSW